MNISNNKSKTGWYWVGNYGNVQTYQPSRNGYFVSNPIGTSYYGNYGVNYQLPCRANLPRDYQYLLAGYNGCFTTTSTD